ncbi:L,D-transpeptidase [Priestia aryabhattai]|uniref:L,D-transpeptidase n=1 Tax=Priestia megaterium TaxID=1404 RepID=UPI0039B9AA19
MRKILLQAAALCLAAIISISYTASTANASGNAANEDLIIINKKINQLAYFHSGKLEKVYLVATGKTWSATPVGFFKIVNKIKNRPYYTGYIAGGAPNNPLGSRWLGLDANGTTGDTYGIHGNNSEASIGKYVSHGCVRMHNADVEELFDKVAVGTSVNITYSSKNFEELAKVYGYGQL